MSLNDTHHSDHSDDTAAPAARVSARFSDGFFARLFQHRPHARLFSATLLALIIALIGAVDHFTGPRLVMILFYIIPVMLGSAWLGGAACYLVPVLCSATHAFADWLGHHEPLTSVTLANRLFVLAIYLIVARCIAELVGLQRHLGQRVQARTLELENALAAQRELQQRIGTASRYERNAIGRELHDGLCQHLAAANIAAGMLAHKLEASGGSAGEARGLCGMLAGAIDQTRQIARGLLLASVKSADLHAELGECCRAAARKHGVACVYAHDGPAAALDDTQAAHLFFIAQEALRNALAHSGARRVDMALRVAPDALTLCVADDGCGIAAAASGPAENPDVENKRSGLGLRIMRHRAELIGGSLEIDTAVSGERKGTRICCRLPGRFAALPDASPVFP